jgi:hypothetical protein
MALAPAVKMDRYFIFCWMTYFKFNNAFLRIEFGTAHNLTRNVRDTVSVCLISVKPLFRGEILTNPIPNGSGIGWQDLTGAT